jgi:flagellar operon protein (TIGR03826 family)
MGKEFCFMDVRQCKRCRKIFNYTGSPICPVCVQESDRQFDEVRNYIYENPQSTLDMVCEETEVAAEDIKRWLKEGRLILHKSSAPLINCEKCGVPIVTGRLCDKCVSNVQSELSGAASSLRPTPAEPPIKKQASKERMHIADRKGR